MAAITEDHLWHWIGHHLTLHADDDGTLTYEDLLMEYMGHVEPSLDDETTANDMQRWVEHQLQLGIDQNKIYAHRPSPDSS